MTYTVSDYLLDRLAELGTTHIFGVPGDFNLQFLDHIVSHRDLEWVGNANELNAGYAADGYARLKGLGALVTTYGVGELSAINATAGAYAEHVPVLHIVGAPSKDAQAAHLVMHHTLGDGDFTHFLRMAGEVSCATANLDHANATREIDRVLTEILTHRRPGYVLLATDVARMQVNPPSAPLVAPEPLSSEGAEKAFREILTSVLPKQKVTVLADLLVHRMGAQAELTSLLKATNFPYATLMWGKTLVDESSPLFAGIYGGVVSNERTRDAVENAQLLVTAGVTFTDTTTAGFSQNLPERTINISAGKTVISTPELGTRTFAPLSIKRALEIFRDVALEVGASGHELLDGATEQNIPEFDENAPLTQDLLWDLLSQQLSSNNIVVADQGTSFFGMASRRFPKDSVFIGQPLWGSIGYTLPALLGAVLAKNDSRGVLLIGDGSAQLTLQELGTIIRERLNPVIFLINNDGYTVERAIHGPDETYNDIQGYDWQLIPRALGAGDEVLTLSVSTPAELLQATAAAEAAQDRLVFIEVKMNRDDVPQLLADVAAAINNVNKKD